jgi:hypothetical protein
MTFSASTNQSNLASISRPAPLAWEVIDAFTCLKVPQAVSTTDDHA